MSETRKTVYIGTVDDYTHAVIINDEFDRFEALGFVDSVDKLGDSTVSVDKMTKAQLLAHAKEVYEIDLDSTQKVGELREEIAKLAALAEE